MAEEKKLKEDKIKKDEEILNFLWEVSTGDYDKDIKDKARRLYLLHSEKNQQRFIISEHTIEDTQTGLIWERDMSKRGEMNWDDAMKINDNGFRLPSREDFKTLSKSKEYPTVKELEEIGFQNVREWYWTSQEYNTSIAWLVLFSFGYAFYYDKTFSGYAVCVKRK